MMFLRIPHALAICAVALSLAGCGGFGSRLSERECLMRAMYFESIRSSDDGMLAVGTVVMNRVASPKYPDSICAVVGQPKQFAPGVLTKPMDQGNVARAERVADQILRGKRHRGVGKALFFHTANVPFRRDNKRYVVVAGGNAFYHFTQPGRGSPPPMQPAPAPSMPMPVPETAIAQAPPPPAPIPEPNVIAREDRERLNEILIANGALY